MFLCWVFLRQPTPTDDPTSGSINDSPINRLRGSCRPGLALLEASQCPGLGPGDTAGTTWGIGCSGTGLALDPCSGSPAPRAVGQLLGTRRLRDSQGPRASEQVKGTLIPADARAGHTSQLPKTPPPQLLFTNSQTGCPPRVTQCWDTAPPAPRALAWLALTLRLIATATPALPGAREAQKSSTGGLQS